MSLSATVGTLFFLVGLVLVVIHRRRSLKAAQAACHPGGRTCSGITIEGP